MTELEVFFHACIMNIKDAIMAKGAAKDEELFIVHTIDLAHREFLKKIQEEIKNQTPAAPQGPGGIKHSE